MINFHNHARLFVLFIGIVIFLLCTRCSEESDLSPFDHDADLDPQQEQDVSADDDLDSDEHLPDIDEEEFPDSEDISDIENDENASEEQDVEETEEIPEECEPDLDPPWEQEVEEELEWDVPPVPPEAGDVIFSELMPFPLALQQNEGQWVELTNRARHPITLQGCEFATSSYSTTIDSPLQIDPRGKILIGVERATTYSNDVTIAWNWGNYILKTGWDSLRISCGETMIDSVTYSENNMGMYLMFGASVSLCPDHLDAEQNDSYDNWRVSGERMPNDDRGTPGETNEPCEFIGGDLDVEIEWDTDIEQWESQEEAPENCLPAHGMTGLPNCGHTVSLPGGMDHETCVIVPQGSCHTYWMGNLPDNWYYFDQREMPRHTVHLTSYALSRFPVTVGEYRQCIEDGGCGRPVAELCHVDGSYLVGEPNIDNPLRTNHPVNCINRYQALEFCHWAGGTLPSEAQWEYGAVGPMESDEDLTNFPWGEDRNECRANIWGNDPFEETSPVGFFDGQRKSREEGGWLFGPDDFQTCDDSSPFGLKDMTHNVSELVLDFPSDYDDWPNESVNPVWWPPLAKGFLSRGSNWVYSEMHHARSHLRTPMSFIPSTFSSIGCGFRCAFTPSE